MACETTRPPNNMREMKLGEPLGFFYHSNQGSWEYVGNRGSLCTIAHPDSTTDGFPRWKCVGHSRR